MKCFSIPTAAVGACLLLCPFANPPAWGDGPVRVQGVGILTRLLKLAQPQLLERGIEIKVAEECSSSQAAAGLGAGEIDVGLLGRAMTIEERAAFPEKQFHDYQVGAQVVAVMVSRTIWESGIRALKREQVAALYEGRVLSWKEFGGEDRHPKFFEPAHGRGVWELFVTWLYGDLRKAPAVSWEVVEGGAEAQNAVQFRSGAVSVAPLRWADRREVFPVAIIDEAGAVIEPTAASVVAGKYPMARPAFLVVGNKPTGAKRKLVEFFSSEAGQAIVAANDLVPLATLKEP